MAAAFQSDAFQGDAFEAVTDASFAITEGSDTAVFNADIVGTATFAIIEDSDVPAFNVTAITAASFAITESGDTPAFTVSLARLVSFDISEAPDVPSLEVTLKDDVYVSFGLVEAGPDTITIEVTATTFAGFSLTELPDVPSFEVVATTFAGFELVEEADTAKFRTIAAFFTHGDADHIQVAPEVNVMAIQPAMDRGSVADEADFATVPDETQRIEVDQTRGYRKEL